MPADSKVSPADSNRIERRMKISPEKLIPAYQPLPLLVLLYYRFVTWVARALVNNDRLSEIPQPGIFYLIVRNVIEYRRCSTAGMLCCQICLDSPRIM